SGARGLSVAHQRVCRPCQRLDAHRRSHRLPRHRHSRLLARHQGGSVRTGLRVVADARSVPVRRPPRPVQAFRSPASGDGMNPKAWWVRLAHQSLVLLTIVYCLFPVYFMLVQSLKSPQEDVFGNPFFVANPTFENFEELFERKSEVRGFVGDALRRSYPFFDWIANTLFVFAGSVLATLVTSVAAGYALGRVHPPGFRVWRRPVLAAHVLPQLFLFIPLFLFIHVLALADSLLALFVVSPSMALPFCVWMLSGYFEHLPREIEEAALIEGASRATAFFHVILPMSRPVLIA